MSYSFTSGQILFASQLMSALGEKIGTDILGTPGGLATLDGGGKIPVAQIPAIAINDVFVVGSEAAMLALTAEKGDVALRTDQSKSYILATNAPGTLADWKEVLVPAGGGVSSVASRTGAVVLVINDLSDAGATGKLLMAASTAAIATALLNTATTSVKGLLPPLSGNANEFLNGNGSYSTPTVAPSFPKGYLFPRAIMANNGTTPNTKVDIAPGAARSSDDTTNLSWASTLTLDITTTGANGLDTSGSRTASGTIHVFVILNGSTHSAFGSSSLSPTLPSGYTKMRRVGSLRLDASQNFRPFVAHGDRITHKTPVAESLVGAFGGSSSTLLSLVGVPSALAVRASLFLSMGTFANYGDYRAWVKDPADADVAPSLSNSNWHANSSVNLEVGTNTSAQVRARSDANLSPTMICFGYLDPRDA